MGAGRALQFESVVFAGGGNRCFWQAGFWSIVAPTLQLAPSGVAAVSAGAAIACALFGGSFGRGFARYKKAVGHNGHNVYLRNLLHAQPVFPHGKMYRDAILGSIDQPALSRLHQGPPISILVSCPPRWAPPRLGVLMGMLAVGLDAWGDQAVHSSVGSRLGFRPLYLSVRDCRTPGALADLIIASSCVPPLTPQARRDGSVLFDGGLVSNVPTDGVSPAGASMLVLLTRQFVRLPAVPGRTYVQPSRPIPVGAWDYTNAAGLQSTFDLGRRDGERFCADVGA